ncbi:MAG: lysoplasmalogenase [Spirochaetales bacterium]|nr:lysoplasmalogenase [Spirochaetales bacterium]
MQYLIFIPIIASSAAVTITADARGIKWLYNSAKVSTTMIIIGLAAFSFVYAARPVSSYTIFIVSALVLSLGGDIALLFKDNRAFITGLVFFLAAHVVYTIAFIISSGFAVMDALPAGMIILLLIILFRSFSEHLGKMLIPVIIYMVIISAMVWRAFSTLFNNSIPVNHSLLIAIGACFFYISDILLGVDKFIFPVDHITFRNLSTYYIAQTMLALSCF